MKDSGKRSEIPTHFFKTLKYNSDLDFWSRNQVPIGLPILSFVDCCAYIFNSFKSFLSFHDSLRTPPLFFGMLCNFHTIQVRVSAGGAGKKHNLIKLSNVYCTLVHPKAIIRLIFARGIIIP